MKQTYNILHKEPTRGLSVKRPNEIIYSTELTELGKVSKKVSRAWGSL